MVTNLTQPGYHQNFYSRKRGGIPLYPDLWPYIKEAWVPALGKTGNKIFNVGRNAPLNFTAIDATAGWTRTSAGVAVAPDGTGYMHSGDVAGVGSGTTSTPYSIFIFGVTTDDGGGTGDDTIYGEHDSGSGTPLFEILKANPSDKYGITLRDNEGSLFFNAFDTVGDYDRTIPRTITWTDNFGDAKLYIDTVQDAQDYSYTQDGTMDFNRATIGARVRPGDTSQIFVGTVGGVITFKKELNLSEIRLLYNDPLAPFRLRQPIYKAAEVAPPAGGLPIGTLNLLGCGV